METCEPTIFMREIMHLTLGIGHFFITNSTQFDGICEGVLPPFLRGWADEVDGVYRFPEVRWSLYMTTCTTNG